RQSSFELDDFLSHPMTRPFASNYSVRNYAFDLQADLATELRTDRFAPSRVFQRDVGSAELQRAKGFIETIDVCGFTEDLPGFVKALADLYGFYPEPELERYRSYRLEVDSVGPDTLRKIREANALDYALYDWARAAMTSGGGSGHRAAPREIPKMTNP